MCCLSGYRWSPCLGGAGWRSMEHIASAAGILSSASVKNWRLPEGGPSTPHLAFHFLLDTPRECVCRERWGHSLFPKIQVGLQTLYPSTPLGSMALNIFLSEASFTRQCELVRSSRHHGMGESNMQEITQTQGF